MPMVQQRSGWKNREESLTMKIKAQSLYVLTLTIYIICKYIFMYIYSRFVHEDSSYSAAVVFKINALCKHCEQLSIENFWPCHASWSSHGVCNCIARGRNAFMQSLVQVGQHLTIVRPKIVGALWKQ